MLKKLVSVSVAALLAVSITACQDKPENTPAKKASDNSPGSGAISMELSTPKAATEALDAERLAKAQSMLNGGISYLLSQREADGGWSFGGGAMKPALTGLVLKCLLGHPDFDRNNPVVKQAFEVMLKYRQPDGAIFDPKQGRPAYTTAIAIMAMVAADDPQYKGAMDGGVKYLKGIQIVPGQESPDGETIAEGDPKVGGIGYGSNKEPNLSVMQFAIEAWHDAGMPADDEAMQKAVGFLTRLQNRSESNPMPYAKEGSNDGGFVYDLITSKAGPGAGSGMRSYGSMTYAGFKSYAYAALKRDDHRVAAAWDWIRRNYTVTRNPGMPPGRAQEGYYYYLMTMARALDAWGERRVVAPDGTSHDWAADLAGALVERQRADGAWVNASSRWMETDTNLVTAYALIALGHAME